MEEKKVNKKPEGKKKRSFLIAMLLNPEVLWVILLMLFGIFLIWLIGHWHEPCFTFNLTEDFWGICR